VQKIGVIVTPNPCAIYHATGRSEETEVTAKKSPEPTFEWACHQCGILPLVAEPVDHFQTTIILVLAPIASTVRYQNYFMP
jgi:hypothetical protein